MWGSLLIAAAMMAAPADPVPVLATTPYFRTLDASDGLPSSTVWKVAQDRDGYIWVGTADGLARYDGVDFRVFRNDPNDAASLSGADVTALTEAKLITVRGEALRRASEACRMHFYQSFLEVLATRLALANQRLANF